MKSRNVNAAIVGAIVGPTATVFVYFYFNIWLWTFGIVNPLRDTEIHWLPALAFGLILGIWAGYSGGNLTLSRAWAYAAWHAVVALVIVLTLMLVYGERNSMLSDRPPEYILIAGPASVFVGAVFGFLHWRLRKSRRT